MFGTLTEKFKDLFSTLAGNKVLTEENLSEAIRQVRLALLDADVNYGVASAFVKRIKDKVLGEAVIKSLSPEQQFIKIVHDELVQLMGGKEESLDLRGNPVVILLCGLQGSGKTTTSAKLALYLKGKAFNKKSLIAACDLQRPAAVEQLKRLGEQAEIVIYAKEGATDPIQVAKEALELAKREQYDVLIVDTAGRLHIDEALMDELHSLKKLLSPHEVLFVASGATGQDAVKTAVEFDQKIGLSGTVLTMLDGTSRAGAALSIREVTQKPLKFEGTGEKLSDFQLFHPSSMADRILGMGDVINLVRRVQENIDEKESQELEKKLQKASFTYEDYIRQMGMIKKMGSFKSLLKMIPGMGDFDKIDLPEKEMKRTEAIIFSMTQSERDEKEELTPHRRRRIAKGSGTSLEEVNRMVKGFKKLKQMMKEMPMLQKKMKKDKNFAGYNPLKPS